MPEQAEVFACPLCKREFEWEYVHSDLSIEHVVPSSLGGRLETLTCRDCNSGSGHRIDADLAELVNARDFFSGLGDETRFSNVRIGNGEFNADFHLSQESVRLIVRPDNSNPERLAEALGVLDDSVSTGADIIGSVSTQFRYDSLRARVSVLKMAYLLLFHYFGYGYIFQPGVSQVREQIACPDQDMFVSWSVLLRGLTPPDPFGVSLVHSPPEIRCFLVTMKLSDKTDDYAGAFLPGMGVEAQDFYSRLRVWRQSQEMAKFSAILLSPTIPSLSDRERWQSLVDVWHHVYR